MICALTVRQLKPGRFEEFMAALRPSPEEAPPGWKSFTALRDGDRVITFGMFDGTREQMEATQVDHGYAERRAAADECAESVLVNGVFDVVQELHAD